MAVVVWIKENGGCLGVLILAAGWGVLGFVFGFLYALGAI